MLVYIFYFYFSFAIIIYCLCTFAQIPAVGFSKKELTDLKKPIGSLTQFKILVFKCFMSTILLNGEKNEISTIKMQM